MIQKQSCYFIDIVLKQILKKKKKNTNRLFLPGFKTGTFGLWGERDPHYIMETYTELCINALGILLNTITKAAMTKVNFERSTMLGQAS